MNVGPPVYRPQLGGVGGGGGSGQQGNQLGHRHGNGSTSERDDGRRYQNGYQDLASPMSPSAGSDFSFTKYSNDTYSQQRNQGYNNEPLPNSVSNNSLISQRSSGSQVAPRDSVVMEHYSALKKYLTRHLAAEGLNQRQNKAREKLIRLSKQQFNELSTDVYDELMRRQNTSSIPEDRIALTSADQPFLTPRDSFHPKRNQARQKLATLPPGRFKELASDVLYEIERRYPVSVETANHHQYLQTEDNMQRTTSASSLGSRASDQSYNPPYSAQSDGLAASASRDRFPSNNSSNTLSSPSKSEADAGAVQRTGLPTSIIPNKSTMVEENVPNEQDVPLQRSASNSNPVQKSFQSNTIVPNTSTMVEESADEMEDNADEDNHRVASTFAPSTAASTKSLSPPIFKSNAFANAGFNGLKNRSVSPPPVIPKSRFQIEAEERKEREMQEKLEEYEDKIEAMKERIVELQDELKKVKEELRLEREKTPPATPVPVTNDRHLRDLEAENDRLKEELREQQEVTNDVRREATELLEEMKSLTSQQDSLFDSQTNSTKEVTRLQSEVKEWKSRYSQLKIQLRSNASSIGSASHLSSPIRMDIKSRMPATEDGVIEDGNISRFQNSIDDLLMAARRDDSEVLELMTEVVKATRAITDDLKRYGNPSVEEDPKVKKLTTRLSATANNLITATKNHVSSHGISPVSLLDAAASHLTSTVVDLVKMVKVRPGSGITFRSDEDAQSDHSRYSETPLTSPMTSTSPPRSTGKSNIPVPLSLGSRSNVARTALRDEVYVPRSPESPRSVDSRRSSSRNAYSKEEEELRLYLDTQTQAIVESIQSLLTRIRNPKLDSLEDFRSQIDEIVTIVEKIVQHTDRQGVKIGRLGDNSRMTSVLHSLEDCCSSMRNISNSSHNNEDGFKKRLARIAFDISKQIKVPSLSLPPYLPHYKADLQELVRIVESESPPNSADLL